MGRGFVHERLKDSLSCLTSRDGRPYTITAGQPEGGHMADWSERAFDLVTEITKQVLTLAAAIIALTITFVKDFAPHPSYHIKVLLGVSWCVYFISIVAGFMTLMASAGLQERASSSGSASINSGNLRFLGGAQIITFMVALILTVIAGIRAI